MPQAPVGAHRLAQPRGTRIPALDGLRGLAAVAVLCFHVYNTTVPDIAHQGWPRPLRFALTSLGANGVSCFFVLSAFLLSQPFLRWLVGDHEMPSLRRYVWHRVLRIYPAWLVILAVMTACVAPWLLSRPLQLIAFLSLNQNYLGLGHAVVAHGWTLGIEISFYVLAPLVGLTASLALRSCSRRMRASLLASGLLAATGVSWAYQVGAVPLVGKHSLGVTLPAYLDRFSLGALAALIVLLFPVRGIRTPALLFAVVVFLLSFGHLTAYRYQLSSLGFALVVLDIASGRGLLHRACATVPLMHLGRLSYGIYLYHLPLLYLAQHAGLLDRGHGIQTLPVIVGLLIASTILAEISFRLIEQPALSLAHRRPARGRSRIGARAAPAARASGEAAGAEHRAEHAPAIGSAAAPATSR